LADRPIAACPIGPIFPDDAGPDRGSFAAIRQSLDRGELPAAELVRTEELINALAGPYEPVNAGAAPAVNVEVASCPWAADHRLVRIALKSPGNANGQQATPATAPAAAEQGLRDVSVRIEFNPATAAAYRLIGYEGRATVTAAAADPGVQPPAPASIPPGRSVTVLYEVIPAGQPVPGAPLATAPAGPVKRPPATARPTDGPELLSVVVRYRDSRTGPPRTTQASARDDARASDAASPAFRAAAAAAALGLTLRVDPHRGAADCDLVLHLLERDATEGPRGPRAALLQAARQAKSLSRPEPPPQTPRN
jgi:hypothetical protein